MAIKKAKFHVDSRLARLLSQEYTSTEKALKELVDNAWDANADSVRVSLPAPMSLEPIEIADDGEGMTQEEVRRNYLAIASDRRELRGVRTVKKQRLVKGRKGIGKFSGFMAARQMALETYANGVCTTFTLRLDDISAVADLEKLNIPLEATACDAALRGTVIRLSELHTGLAFPDPKKLRQILLQEYGREQGMQIVVNGKSLSVDDVSGVFHERTFTVDTVGECKMRYAISEDKAVSRQPGIVIKVDGKVVGKPTFFGLEERNDFPPKLLKRLYGEIDADGLYPHVTAGWDSLVENSEKLTLLADVVRPHIFDSFKERYGREIQLAQARLRREVHERLARLPTHRREYAERAVKRILERFYDESPERIEPYVFVLLEAIESSDYATLLAHMAEASRGDVASIAEALSEFGLVEMAYLVEQARARQTFLDRLEDLGRKPETLEAEMHKAIEKNLWLLGAEYSLFSSNRTLRRQVEDVLEKKYIGRNASTRPDLLLNENLDGHCLLIEFKRPSHPLNYEDYQQATRYRHDLRTVLSKPVRVVVMGARKSADFPVQNLEPEVKAVSYEDAIASARRLLEWQLRTPE
jgi:hypothetical protein